MGEIFKVEFLKRCAWAASGIHKCSWSGRSVDTDGALGRMQRWVWEAEGTEAPMGLVVSLVRITFLQVQGYHLLSVAADVATLCVTWAYDGVRVYSLQVLVIEDFLCFSFTDLGRNISAPAEHSGLWEKCNERVFGGKLCSLWGK